MLRRTALVAALALPLAGCVTYYEAGGGRYAERAIDSYDRHRGVRYGTTRDGVPVVIVDDPYDRWFYGWRGHGPAWSAYPFHDGRWYGSVHYGRGWSAARWAWSPWHVPVWGWGGSGWGGSPWYGHGGWHGGPVHRPPPRPSEPRPMPKPVAIGGRPDTGGPVRSGPALRGEPLQPLPGPREWRDPEPAAEVAIPVARPRFEEPPPRFEEPPPRFEEPPPRFEEPPPRFEEPPPRFEEPPMAREIER